MVELVRTNDPVQISLLMGRLAEAGIEAVVFDGHASAIEGSIGILPRRIMVIDDDLERARAVLAELDSGA